MHAGQALLLVVHRRCAARLVVGDDQLAIGVELQAVDDAVQRQRVDLCREAQFEPDLANGGGILHAEVVADQLVTLALELDDLVGAEPEKRELRIAAVLGQRRLERGVEPCRGAVAGGQHEEQLERAVHQRSACHVDAGRLGQFLDARESERHRARRERLDPGG